MRMSTSRSYFLTCAELSTERRREADAAHSSSVRATIRRYMVTGDRVTAIGD